MVAGRPTTTRGRGYFRYAIGEDGDHYIRGEWGHDDQITGGGPWNAVRDRRARPRTSSGERTSGNENIEAFDSAGGDSFDSAGGGDDLGDSGSEEDDLDLGDI